MLSSAKARWRAQPHRVAQPRQPGKVWAEEQRGGGDDGCRGRKDGGRLRCDPSPDLPVTSAPAMMVRSARPAAVGVHGTSGSMRPRSAAPSVTGARLTRRPRWSAAGDAPRAARPSLRAPVRCHTPRQEGTDPDTGRPSGQPAQNLNPTLVISARLTRNSAAAASVASRPCSLSKGDHCTGPRWPHWAPPHPGESLSLVEGTAGTSDAACGLGARRVPAARAVADELSGPLPSRRPDPGNPWPAGGLITQRGLAPGGDPFEPERNFHPDTETGWTGPHRWNAGGGANSRSEAA